MEDQYRIDGADLIVRNARSAANRKPEGNGWGERHASALNAVATVESSSPARLHEAGIVQMLKGWALYADAHYNQFESLIGHDYVLGPAWLEMGKSLRTLLNGEMGRLDGGMTDGLILDLLKHNGFETENL